jgi:nucleotide-binding universal stress UspA family protein
MDRVGADVKPLIATAKAAAREEMSELTRMSILAGVSCETEIRTGSAIDEICAETGRDDIDLVVTSTHGRTGFKRALLGSVAEHVVRYAECPVIIVPSRGRS